MRRALLGFLCIAACNDFDHALTVCMQNGGCAVPLHVTVTNDGGAVSDFPLFVPLQPSHVANVVDPFHDLRFVDDATGQPLPFEGDHWDAGGESSVWVRLPHLDGRATLTLTTGPLAHGQADAGAVWSGYELVHHFEPALASSVDGRYRGGPIGTGGHLAPGYVGEGYGFTGGGGEQTLDFDGGSALFNGWPAFTMSFWLYPDYASAADFMGEPMFMDKGGSLDLGRVLSPPGGTRFQIDLHFTGANDAYLGGDVTLRQWLFIVYTFDGTNLQVYVDGAPADAQVMKVPQALLMGTNPFVLGSHSSAMNGAVDELFIEQRGRDAAWIWTQYQSMTRQLVTIGP